jgi:ubiquinone/menaquinone biosynthesis C-methylase UbiE
MFRVPHALLFDLGALPYAILTAQPVWRAHGGELAVRVQATSRSRVLDLGCGPGESAFGMIERVPGVRVTGLDVSASMIRFAQLRQRSRGAAARDIEFVQGDAMKLPFADATFDAVVGHSFLYLVPDAAQVLREAARVLRPGGRVAFLEPRDAPEIAPLPLPRSIVLQAFKEPRFVASMVFWRLVSRGYGRFDEARFRRVFGDVDLALEAFEPTLGGLGAFGVGRKAVATA